MAPDTEVGAEAGAKTVAIRGAKLIRISLGGPSMNMQGSSARGPARSRARPGPVVLYGPRVSGSGLQHARYPAGAHELARRQRQAAGQVTSLHTQ